MDVPSSEESQMAEEMDAPGTLEIVGDGGVESNVIDSDSTQLVVIEKKPPDKLDAQIEPDPTPSEPTESAPATSSSIMAEIRSPIPIPTGPVLPVQFPTTPDVRQKASISRPASPRQTLTMPALTNLAELTLHSPSSQIVGTPFATNSTRFEYPFPESSSDPSSVSGSPPSCRTSPSATLTSFSHTISPGIASGSPFSGLSSSPSASQISYPNIELPTGGVTHPKLKAPAANPPIPPSLMKKRPKWSLGILGRRRSSQSSGGSQDRISPTTIESLFSTQKGGSTPFTSPREERN